MSHSRRFNPSPEAHPTSTHATNVRADNASRSALASAKQNIGYLLDPKGSPAPGKFRTRAFLRSLRYISIFIFWRIVRYAKYALVGSAIAALSATAIGGAVSGVGLLLAPSTLFGSAGIGLIWSIGKYGFRKMGVGPRGAKHVSVEREGIRKDGEWRDITGPDAEAW